MWLFLTMKAVNKDIISKKKITDNHVHNILRLFGGWASYPFITSEKKHVYQ